MSERRPAGRSRRLLWAALLVLTTVVTALTIPAVWTHRTLLDSDAFVERVSPIAFDPRVTPVLSERFTDQILELIDVDGVIESALPERARVLAGPLTEAIRDFVQEHVSRALDSDRFREIWVASTRFAHQQLVAVLRGESEAVATEGDVVVLDLLPVVNEALRRIEANSPGLFRREVVLPEIQSGDPSDDARMEIAAALGVDVPVDFGTIEVFDADRLSPVQDAVRFFDLAFVALALSSLVLVAAALVLSNDRRRTLLQLALGLALGLVVERALVGWSEEQLVDLARTPEGGRALAAVGEQIFGSFFTATTAILLVGAAICCVLMIFGPSAWAARVRTRGRRAATPAPPRDEGRSGWIGEHRVALRAAGVIVVVLLLVLFDVPWTGFLLLLVLLLVYQGLLLRVGAP